MNEPTMDAALDRPRLSTLRDRVANALLDGEWLTLRELQDRCGNSEAGISARLRELRNKFGFTINRRRRGVATKGIWEYQIERHTHE
jgi:biotin operon repressor